LISKPSRRVAAKLAIPAPRNCGKAVEEEDEERGGRTELIQVAELWSGMVCEERNLGNREPRVFNQTKTKL
jgi:hypothetical protein